MTEPDFLKKSLGGQEGGKSFLGFFGDFLETTLTILMKFWVSLVISNISRKPQVLVFSFSGCTVGARPLFWRLFLCDKTLWQSDAEFGTTWNLKRMYSRYSYLKIKKFFSKLFFKFFFRVFWQFSRKRKKRSWGQVPSRDVTVLEICHFIEVIT